MRIRDRLLDEGRVAALIMYDEGTTMTLDERRALCGVKYINGHRVNIGGARNEFADVYWYGTGREEIYSWEAIKRLTQ